MNSKWSKMNKTERKNLATTVQGRWRISLFFFLFISVHTLLIPWLPLILRISGLQYLGIAVVMFLILALSLVSVKFSLTLVTSTRNGAFRRLLLFILLSTSLCLYIAAVSLLPNDIKYDQCKGGINIGSLMNEASSNTVVTVPSNFSSTMTSAHQEENITVKPTEEVVPTNMPVNLTTIQPITSMNETMYQNLSMITTNSPDDFTDNPVSAFSEGTAISEEESLANVSPWISDNSSDSSTNSNQPTISYDDSPSTSTTVSPNNGFATTSERPHTHPHHSSNSKRPNSSSNRRLFAPNHHLYGSSKHPEEQRSNFFINQHNQRQLNDQSRGSYRNFNLESVNNIANDRFSKDFEQSPQYYVAEDLQGNSFDEIPSEKSYDFSNYYNEDTSRYRRNADDDNTDENEEVSFRSKYFKLAANLTTDHDINDSNSDSTLSEGNSSHSWLWVSFMLMIASFLGSGIEASVTRLWHCYSHGYHLFHNSPRYDLGGDDLLERTLTDTFELSASGEHYGRSRLMAGVAVLSCSLLLAFGCQVS